MRAGVRRGVRACAEVDFDSSLSITHYARSCSNEQTVRSETKGCGGLRPSFSAHGRWCERRAPVWICGSRSRLEGETHGIPHLAKNERDVGHPAIGPGIEPKSVLQSPKYDLSFMAHWSRA
jgi:hypothetical protein